MKTFLYRWYPVLILLVTALVLLASHMDNRMRVTRMQEDVLDLREQLLKLTLNQKNMNDLLIKNAESDLITQQAVNVLMAKESK